MNASLRMLVQRDVLDKIKTELDTNQTTKELIDGRRVLLLARAPSPSLSLSLPPSPSPSPSLTLSLSLSPSPSLSLRN